MAKEIGIHTLMEGVETREQAEFARSIGCELIQGYYYGRPMSFEELKQMYREKRWQVETPELRQYYGKLGSIDFLTDRPMAVAEVAGNRFRYLLPMKNTGIPSRLRAWKASGKRKCSSMPWQAPSAKHPQFLHDVIHTSSEKTLTYTVNGRYMRLEASYLASHDKHHLLLLYLTNFTIQEDQNASDSLDWVNRNLLYLYQNVSLVDMETIRPFLWS